MLGIGDRAAAFEIPGLSGPPVSLVSLQERGPVLLAFFKVSCPTCQLTFPFLERIAKGGQLPVVGISQDDAAATKKFRDHFSLQFPMLLDGAAQKYPVSNAFRITHVPSLFVVEPDNTISFAIKGFSRKDLENLGHRFHVGVFRDGESTPDFRPG